MYSPTDNAIKDSWLVLHPGESGKLDLSVDFLKYGKLDSTDIEQSVLGMHTQKIATYYIMNVSDDKPKFIVSRKPFMPLPEASSDDDYELEDSLA